MSDDLVSTDPWSQPVVVVDLTPNMVAGVLIQFSRELRSLIIELKQLGKAAAEAKKTAEITYARAFMNAQGTMDERKQWALHQASDDRYAADLAERAVAGCKAAIQSLHADIDIARTLSATSRDELKTLGVAP